MKTWVARHPLAAHFVLAYGLSWGVAVPLALQARGVLHTSAPLALHYGVGCRRGLEVRVALWPDPRSRGPVEAQEC